MHLDAILLARLQFAFTIAWHIIFPSFTIGLASYLAGPSVIDFVNDFGIGTTLILVALILAGVSVELLRRHRRRRGPAQS